MSKPRSQAAKDATIRTEQRYARWCAYVGVPHEFSSVPTPNQE